MIDGRPMIFHHTAVLIPAHNEQSTVAQVICQVRALRLPVVVIDDLSHDATAQVARDAGATVLPLPLQLGAWGATQAGIRYAQARGYKTVVTLDADGQHIAAHIPELLAPIIAGQADVVIGACPVRGSRARRIAWQYFRWLTGLKIEDITSGFRAYNHAAIETLASAEASLIDYQDVGVLLIMRRRKLRIKEVLVKMQLRHHGASRVFSSWLVVVRYMLQTTVLCLAQVGASRPPPARQAADKHN